MQLAFIIISCIIVGSAIAAMSLRRLIHCALSLALALTGLAALFIQLHAEFVGFAQILVYVGAVAILIVFAILLTHNDATETRTALGLKPIAIGIGTALLVFSCLAAGILRSDMPKPPPLAPDITAGKIGESLTTNYVLPLEAVGLLLTAAVIGAAIIAMPNKRP